MEKTSLPIHAIMIGAGQRGTDVYGAYALKYPTKLKFVAVAEPNDTRRDKFAQLHHIPPEHQYRSWEEIFKKPKFARAVLVCTQDQLHTSPTIAALNAGYDVLLEKPMATTARETHAIVQAAERCGRQLHICHVLRYTKHFQIMREFIQSGTLGQVIHISHNENVSWWHMAHSYVRGNWRRRDECAPMILTKCSHDLDLLIWMTGGQVQYLTSSGSLTHYRAENAPAGAPERCLDGCPAQEECKYYAPYFYQSLIPLFRSFAHGARGFPRIAMLAYLRAPALVRALSHMIPLLRMITDYSGWPLTVLTSEPTAENINHALREGPYGRCVYHGDNDVVDHQIVNMVFANNLTATLTMHGHSDIECRTTRIEGTRATLRGYFGLGGAWIELHHHLSGKRVRYDTSAPLDVGHGGGDVALLDGFVQSLVNEDDTAALTTARQSLESHLLAFAADKARLENRVVYLDELHSL